MTDILRVRPLSTPFNIIFDQRSTDHVEIRLSQGAYRCTSRRNQRGSPEGPRGQTQRSTFLWVTETPLPQFPLRDTAKPFRIHHSCCPRVFRRATDSCAPGTVVALGTAEHSQLTPMAQKTEKGWHEVLIATTEESKAMAEGTEAEPKADVVKMDTPRLRRVLTREPSIMSRLLGHSSTRFDSLPVGTTIEVSPNSFRIAHDAAMLLSSKPPLAEAEAAPSPDSQLSAGGCGLIIDYGGAHVHGTSFRVSSSQISFGWNGQDAKLYRPSRNTNKSTHSSALESATSPPTSTLHI